MFFIRIWMWQITIYCIIYLSCIKIKFLSVIPRFFFCHFTAYIQGAAALCVITLLMDIAATVMTGMGLCSKDPTRKYALYRFALYVMVGACKFF